MSITVNDILNLPCMHGSKVVAGAGGLTKVISSVTVLEFSDANEQQKEILTTQIKDSLNKLSNDTLDLTKKFIKK